MKVDHMLYNLNPEIDLPKCDFKEMPVKLAMNAQGVQLSTNPLQARAVGRAFAQLSTGDWRLVPLKTNLVTDGKQGAARILTIENTQTGERRHILGYKIVAEAGKAYIRTLTANGKLAWARFNSGRVPTVPGPIANGREYTYYSVCVERPVLDENGLPTGRLHPVELSNSSYSGETRRIIGRQNDLGITLNSKEFLHPFDHLNKFTLMAFMLAEIPLAMRVAGHDRDEIKEIISHFYKEEWATSILGMEYRDVVLQPEA